MKKRSYLNLLYVFWFVKHLSFPCRETLASSCMACRGGSRAGSGRAPRTLTRTLLQPRTMSSVGWMAPSCTTTSPSTMLGWVTNTGQLFCFYYCCYPGMDPNRLLEHHECLEERFLQLQSQPLSPRHHLPTTVLDQTVMLVVLIPREKQNKKTLAT